MRQVATILIAILASLVLAGAAVLAQGATAQVTGAVKDQTGAVLPGVEITVTQTETGVSRNTLTNEAGLYALPNLAVGPYRLEASLPGFRTYVQTGIVLQVGSSPVINIVLDVGQVSEHVEVEANATMVETRGSGVGQVMENQRILELPLNGRNVTELIVLSGGAVQTGNVLSQGQAPLLAVAGGVAYATSYKLDGAPHINFRNGGSLPMPFPDALQEFKVETSALSAEHGQSTSVGAVTKSGTNEFHGNLFEFVRNDLFNARSYFARTNSTLKRHQFGGTIGGPIIKNRLFFFAAYQGTTLRQDPANMESFVPTPAMLAGDFTAFTSPACNAGRQVSLRSPFVNNRIDPVQFNRTALTILSRLPKSEDPCGRIVYGRRTVQDDGQVVGKVDYQWSPTHSVFGRYTALITDIPSPLSFTPDNLLNANTTGRDALAQSYLFGDTYLIGTNTVNAFRLAVNRAAEHRIGNETFSACSVGINIYCGYIPNYMSLSVTGAFVFGNGNSADGTWRSTYYVASDDLSTIRGTHQMAFGAYFAHGRHNTNTRSIAVGNFTFNGQETGLGVGDYLLGRLSEFQQGGPNGHYVRQSFLSMYAADVWKMTSRLTASYGLRWEPFLPQVLTNRAVYNFDYERFRQGIKTTVFNNAPAGFYYPGDPGFPGSRGIDRQWLTFAPRIGLAWDVKGDGRSSVRASYGLSYAYVPMDWRLDAGRASPWGAETRIPSPPGGFENPWQGVPGGNVLPLTYGPDARFAPYGLFQTMPYDIKPTNSSTWNLALQQQLGNEWLVSMSYIGTQTAHVWAQKALNRARYFPGGPCTINGVTYNPCSSTANTNARRQLSFERPQDGQLIGILSEYDDGGTMTYHGMVASVQRRAARGVTVNGNYTWSHCLGDYADTNGDRGIGAEDTYQDPNNRDRDRGDCLGDRRHIFNFTAVAETPQFTNPTLRTLATGWRLSGIYRRSSGAPLTVLAGTDRALNGILNQRANQVLDSVYRDTSGRPGTLYLNSAALTIPALGTLGNMGRNSVRGLAVWQFDAALSRVFQIRESHRLEVRAEAYNVTNSFRPVDPSTALNNVNTFGQIRAARDPRIMQFALKYVF